jgi:hypothetical protein
MIVLLRARSETIFFVLGQAASLAKALLHCPCPDMRETGVTGEKSTTGRNRAHTSHESPATMS